MGRHEMTSLTRRWKGRLYAVLAVAAFSATMPLIAYMVSIDGVTWVYNISAGNAT